MRSEKIESAQTASTSGTLSIAPRTKATVRFAVRNDATMATASMAIPTNQ